jgi:hypothetical protein
MATYDKEPAAQAQIRTSWRLTFRYDGTRIELIDRKRVQMIAPPITGGRPIAGEHNGTWLELRDAADQVIYHRDLRRLLGAEVEVFQPDGTVNHVVGMPGRGQFELVVPDLPQAISVTVVSSPFEEKAMHEAAREIARFSLRSPG